MELEEKIDKISLDFKVFREENEKKLENSEGKLGEITKEKEILSKKTIFLEEALRNSNEKLLSSDKTQRSDFSVEIARIQLEFAKEKQEIQKENQQNTQFLSFSHEKVDFFLKK